MDGQTDGWVNRPIIELRAQTKKQQKKTCEQSVITIKTTTL